jgi:CRP-like cAMP-binding protein
VGGPVGIVAPQDIAPAAQTPAPRRSGRRTIPPGAPLDQVNLGQVVPGARQGVNERGEDSGVFEIPIDEDSGVILIEETDLLEDIEIIQEEERLSEGAKRALHDTPLLSSLGPDAMQRLIDKVELVQLEPGQVLFRQGDAGDALYVVAEGSVSVISEGLPRVTHDNLGEGEFFGEIAVVTDEPRSATIEAHAQTGAQLLAIAREVISDLVEEEPAVLQALLRFLRDRLVDTLVASSPLFAPFLGEERSELAARFRFLEAQAGAVILQQGVKASGFFIVLAGQLDAIYRDASRERVIGQLRPGDVCGEMSLLSHAPAEATMRAVTKSFLLELPAAVFREVIMTHPQVLMIVSDLADSRRQVLQRVLAGQGEYPTGGMRLV